MKNLIKTALIFIIFFLLKTQANAQVKINAKAVKAGADVVKAATLSDAEVIKVTKEYIQWMDEHNPVAPDTDTEYAQRLKKLTAGMENLYGVNFNFKVYLVRDINAFACADGSVRVFAGLMNIMTDDELVGILGHEVGHVKNHDSRDAMRRAAMNSAFRDGVASQGGAAAALSESQLGDLGEALANAQFSQKQETEADDNGFEVLKSSGRSVRAMASAFRKLDALSSGEGAKSKKAFSSHPDPAKRAERMDKKADELEAKGKK